MTNIVRNIGGGIERLGAGIEGRKTTIWALASAVIALTIGADYYGVDGTPGFGNLTSIAAVPGVFAAGYGVTVIWGLLRYGRIV